MSMTSSDLSATTGASDSSRDDKGPEKGLSPVPPPINGEVQESVDPFDYAETIVRDLALHVGSRLRDFRSDLSAMHSAVIQLPETMKINALGQSIQELRERLAHLTGVVSQQVTRYPEELDRVARTSSDLMNRVAGVESWIAAARQSLAQGETPNLPSPTGGFVGQDQLNLVVGQIHESLLRVVSAVRDLQLDLRDLRSDFRHGGVPAAGSPEAGTDSSALDALTARVQQLEARPAASPATAPIPASAGAGAVAALVLGAWSRLSQPIGAAALRQTVESVVAALKSRLDQVVTPPQVARGSGIVAVATAERGGKPHVVLVATEDLCGRTWSLSGGGAEMRSPETGDKPAASRTPCWRALLGAAALVQQQQPDAVLLPVLIYGHGQIDLVPAREDILGYGRAVGAGAAAERLLSLSAGDLELPGLARPQDLFPALTALGL